MTRRFTIPLLAAVLSIGAATQWTPGIRVVDGDTVDAGTMTEMNVMGSRPMTLEMIARADAIHADFEALHSKFWIEGTTVQ